MLQSCQAQSYVFQFLSIKFFSTIITVFTRCSSVYFEKKMDRLLRQDTDQREKISSQFYWQSASQQPASESVSQSFIQTAIQSDSLSVRQ